MEGGGKFGGHSGASGQVGMLSKVLDGWERERKNMTLHTRSGKRK